MMPLPLDVATTQKIAWAEDCFNTYGQQLLAHPPIARLLSAFKKANKDSWERMRALGIPAICAECAAHQESCCLKRIDRKYDAVMLLINLLLGVNLPHKPVYSDACFFLGPKGCRLWARETICINFLCDKITSTIPHEEIVSLQQITGQEMEVLFLLQEEIKKWLLAQA